MSTIPTPLADIEERLLTEALGSRVSGCVPADFARELEQLAANLAAALEGVLNAPSILMSPFARFSSRWTP